MKYAQLLLPTKNTKQYRTNEKKNPFVRFSFRMCWRKCASVCIIVGYQCQIIETYVCGSILFDRKTEPKLKNETLCGSSNSILAFKNKFNFRGLLHFIRNKWTLNTILLSIHRNQLTQFRISQLKSYWTMCRNLVLIREGETSFCSFACSLNWIRVPLLFSRPFFVCVIHLSIFQCHIVSLFESFFTSFCFEYCFT